MRKLTFLFTAISLSAFTTLAQYPGQEASKSSTHKSKFQTTGANFHSSDLVIPTHRNCYTTEATQNLSSKYDLPSQEAFEEEFSVLRAQYAARRAANRVQETVITIPVVVHVVHNGQAVGNGPNISSAQVQSQIDVLNEDFRRAEGTNGDNDNAVGADIGIEFVLALRDEDGNDLDEPGIDRIDGGRSQWKYSQVEGDLKASTIWDPTKYFNIWTVNFGGDEDSESLLGYAQFPSFSGLSGLLSNGGPASTDGVVVVYWAFGREGNVFAPFDLGRTTTHEVGHWLGLRHIWGDGGCLDDDYCDDTPRAGDANYECKTIDSCPAFSGNDMIKNYMDYTPDACMNIFTLDQKERILTVMDNSPRRVELKSSTVHLDNALAASLNVDNDLACIGEEIQFADQSSGNPTSWEWIFFDKDSTRLETYTSTVQNPVIIFNESGVYSFILSVKNEEDSAGIWVKEYIHILSDTEATFPFEEDFEDGFGLENWTLYNLFGDHTWELVDLSSLGGDLCLYIDNYSGEDGDPTGKDDALNSPVLNLTEYDDAYLTFDVAYARYDDQFSDELIIFVSSDCGDTWEELWSKSGSNLATEADTESAYLPSEEGWRSEHISLSPYNDMDIHLAIVNRSGWGNNLYLDNIKLAVPDPVLPVADWYASVDSISIDSYVSFYDQSTGYPNSWSWAFEGGSPATSISQYPKVYYNSTGSFDVELSVSNEFGSDDMVVLNKIVVMPNPTVSFASNRENESICFGDSLELTASGAETFKWYDLRGSEVSNSAVFKVTPQMSSSYTLVGYDRYGGSDTVQVDISVYGTPEIDLGVDTTIFQDQSITLIVGSGAENHIWSTGYTFDTLVLSGTELGVGEHEISVTASNGAICSAFDEIVIKVIETPLGNAYEQIEVNLFPNPAVDLMTIEVPSDSFQKLHVYDIKGEMLLSQNIDHSQTRLDVSALAQGMYLVRLSGDKGQKTVRFVKR